jgi:hypothetical protein
MRRPGKHKRHRGAKEAEPMPSSSRNFAAILLLLLVAVEFGGGSLLNLLTRRIP